MGFMELLRSPYIVFDVNIFISENWYPKMTLLAWKMQIDEKNVVVHKLTWIMVAIVPSTNFIWKFFLVSTICTGFQQ